MERYPLKRQASFARTGGSEQIIAEATSYLANVQVRYARDLGGVSAEREIVSDSASETFASAACLKHIDLIVMCFPRGATVSQWNLERIAQQGTHQKHIPLLIMSDQEKSISGLDDTSPLRILLPLDGSLFAERALKPVLQFLSQWSAPRTNEICLIRVIDLLAGEGTGAEEAHMSLYTAKQARQEAERYLHTIAARLCQMVAMATHGHEERSLLNLESVAEHIVNETFHPLLLCLLKKQWSGLLRLSSLPIVGSKSIEERYCERDVSISRGSVMGLGIAYLILFSG